MCEKRLRLLTKEQLNNDLLKGRKIYGKVRVGSPCIFCLIIWPFRPLRRRGVEEGLGQQEKFSSSPLLKMNLFSEGPLFIFFLRGLGCFLSLPPLFRPWRMTRSDPVWVKKRGFSYSLPSFFSPFFLVLLILVRTGFVWLSKENQLGCFKSHLVLLPLLLARNQMEEVVFVW